MYFVERCDGVVCLLSQPRLEAMWAMKAYNHAEIYFNVRSSVTQLLLHVSLFLHEVTCEILVI